MHVLLRNRINHLETHMSTIYPGILKPFFVYFCCYTVYEYEQIQDVPSESFYDKAWGIKRMSTNLYKYIEDVPSYSLYDDNDDDYDDIWKNKRVSSQFNYSKI
jgi:hypothetical protein